MGFMRIQFHQRIPLLNACIITFSNIFIHLTLNRIFSNETNDEKTKERPRSFVVSDILRLKRVVRTALPFLFVCCSDIGKEIVAQAISYI